MKELVIFDLDGTLFDTTLAMQECGNYALSRLGMKELEKSVYARASGRSLSEFVSAVLIKAGDRECLHQEAFWQYYSEKNKMLSVNSNIPYEKIHKLLAILKEKKVRLAVLSNKDHASCVPIIEESFGKDCFDLICGDDGSFKPKPDPQGLFRILEKLQIAKEDCLYVGDTEIDMQTGKNAGVFTVGALWGYRTKEELEAFQPDVLASSPLDLLDYTLI